MNIRKRIIICTAILTAALLTGCAGSQTADSSDTAETTAAAAADNSTPSESSAEASEQSGVVFSQPSGFYKKVIELELSCSVADAKIYYTTDGSTPDETSELYTGAIHLEDRSSAENVISAATGITAGEEYIPRKKVDKGNVIRAVAVYPDGTSSPVSSATYFIGINLLNKYGSVPVISLMTDNENLFNYETGIYIKGKTYDDWINADPNNKHLEAWQAEGNYSNSGKEWERPVSVELINSDGSAGFCQDMGMRIMGAASRNATQKSLKLTAREEYGKKAVEYELIPDNLRSDGTGNVTKYKSFVLRNGGNDCDYAKVRDPLFHSLIADRAVETQQFTPCVTFLNGEYWGMYTIVEDYSDNYFENNYGVDNKNVILLKRGEIEDGEESDIEYYNEMFDFITENNMALPENYEKAAEMLNLQSYADYCAFNLYIYNEDSIFKDNNWRMWRVRETDASVPVGDGKWRMIVYDTDYSAGIYEDGGNYGRDNISEVFSSGYGSYTDEETGEKYRCPKDIFISLCQNEEFLEMFITSMCDIRNINFNSNDAIEELWSLYGVYGELVPDTFNRFGPSWIARGDTERYYEQKIAGLANFIDGRYIKMPGIMQKVFGLGDMAKMTVLSSDKTGAVRINNSVTSLDKDFNGTYFTDYTVTVTAIPDEGRTFKEWKSTGCALSDSTSPTAEVTFTGDFSLEAVFE